MNSSVLEPHENPTFNFTPLPRRPLRSQTYRTFVQILSHCAALQSPQLPPEQAGEISVQKELVPHDSVVLQESPAGFVDGDIHKMPNEVNCLDPMDAEAEGNGKERDVNDVCLVDSSEENNAHNRIVCHIVDEKKSSCTAGGHEGTKEQKLDKLQILHDFEIPDDFCLHTDTVLEVSAPPQLGDDTSYKDGRDLSEELRMKEKELEELICAPAAVDLSDCLAAAVNLPVCLAVDDFEEGEVSGDEALFETMDFLFDSAGTQEGHVSENQNVTIGLSEMDMTGFFSPENVHSSNDMPEMQSTITHLDANKESFPCEGRVETNKPDKSDSAIEIGQILGKGVEVKSNFTALAEDLAPHRKIVSKNITQDRDVLTNEKDVCVAKNEKIKKRGPITKERKAKKKKKERIKRAEMNRKLGVKRLKLQPVVKQKKVTYCRHYMKGRCQEGEKCNYSHDTTPLTKSMPCCHFARQSCMKGDECPYDHQLSKYPCNNYVTNGFCHRGADCMFSHELSVTAGSLTSQKICKPDLKSPVQNSDLNPNKQMKLDSNFRSMEKSTSGKSSDKKGVPGPKKPVAVPKGISMISFAGPSSSSKHDKSPITKPVEETVVNLDQQATINSLKSNEVVNKVGLRPNGVNFLSFGKTPLNASQFVGELNRSSNKAPENSNQSSMNMAPIKNMNLDACTPQGLKFLSFGKKREDNISGGSLPTQGRGNTFGGPPKSSIGMPQGSSCSSNPFSLCSDNYSAGGGGTSFSRKECVLSNVPKSAMKALNSTLAFAAKFDSHIRMAPCSKMILRDGTNFA